MRLAITATIGDQIRIWPIEGSPVRIGRGAANTVHIPFRGVSREHAEIVTRGGRLLLRDLRSRNGTWVNGVPVRRPVPVGIGDNIRVGPVSLYVTEEPPEQPDAHDDTSNISATTIDVPAATVLGRGRGWTSPGGLLRLLEKAGHLLVQHRSLRQACDAVLQGVEMVLPGTRIILLLRNGAQGPLVRVAERIGDRASSAPLLLSESQLTAALERRAPALAGERLGPKALVVPLRHESRALGLLYVDHADPAFQVDRETRDVLALFADMAATRIANEEMMDAVKQNAQIERQLIMAGRIQRCLLPTPLPSVRGYEFHARLDPCERVAGDFYDVAPAEDGAVWFMLGDVAGKGICASILMSVCLSMARGLYDAHDDPGDLATRLNALLSQRIEDEHFVTTFIGRLDPVTGAFTYVNAGHPAPRLVHGRAIERLRSTGAAMGGLFPDFHYRAEAASLEPGALLALFSDGIQEARRRGLQFFGEERLDEALEHAAQCDSLEKAERSIFQRVDTFMSGRPRTDDIALLLIRRRSTKRRKP